MYNSERLIFAIGELSDEKIERAGVILSGRKAKSIGSASRISRALGTAAVLILMLGIGVTAYPVYIHWSRGMEQSLPATGEEQIYAEDSGLSQAFPAEAAAAKAESSEESILYDSAQAGSSTVNGVTISAEQTVIDRGTARIALRIEGFELPEGQYPDIGMNWSLTFDGERAPAVTGGFVGEKDADGRLVYTAPDGSMEFDFFSGAGDSWASFEGKEIRIVIDSLGCGDKGMYEPLVEGPWELVWTPSVNSEVSCFRPDTDIGNTGIKLVSAEIAPVSAKVILALPAYWDGYETLESYDLQLAGVRLEDGTVLTDIFGYPIQEGYADIDNLLLELIYSSEHILRPGQVDALLFAQGYPWTKPLSAEELIVVPVT